MLLRKNKGNFLPHTNRPQPGSAPKPPLAGDATPIPDEGSVTGHVRILKTGDKRGVDALWGRYFDRLVELARQKLTRKGSQVASAEDVAGSVLRLLWAGTRRKVFDHLNDRHDLWRILVVLTERKAIDKNRRGVAERRGGNEPVPLGGEYLNHVPCDKPTPAFLAALNDEQQRLLRLLPSDAYRQIVLWKLEGHSNAEMAQMLDVSTRTIERKLELVRECWVEEVRQTSNRSREKDT